MKDVIATEANSRPLRILHVTATTTGGVGQVILDLCQLSDSSRFEMDVATGRGYWLDRKFIDSGVELYSLPMSRKVRFSELIRSFVKLYRLLREKRYDIVHTHTSIGGIVGRLSAKATGVPLVLFHIHGLASHPFQSNSQRKFYWLVEKLLDFATDHYVSVSADYMRMAVESGLCPEDKISIIVNGIAVSGHQDDFSAQDREQLRAELEISPGQPIVGTVTRLERQKDIPTLLKAFREVLHAVPHAKLLVVGDGPQRVDMEFLARSLGIQANLCFLGWREDISRLLALFDVFVLSSRWEGCPIALLEAMSYGLPVAVTAAVGVREIIEPEVNGLLAPTDDPPSLARATVRILQDPRLARMLSENAMQAVRLLYSVKRMTEQHEALYLKLLSMKRATSLWLAK